MIVSTLFKSNGEFSIGAVELKLLPGIPQLNVVGLPDAAIKESGIKIRSALKSLGLKWPSGHMLVVNLRPSTLRKVSAGVELAIAMALLSLTDQLAPTIVELVKNSILYGEIGLDGRIFAPDDIDAALLAANAGRVVTGPIVSEVRQGTWTELTNLNDEEPRLREHVFDWDAFWQKPEVPDLCLTPFAARALQISLHANLSVLLAGPPGSGKTTWARALYALSPPPRARERLELAQMIGPEAWDSRWRPLEQPHHTSSPLAMVGGGVPVRAGVISRAHGGVLVLDELLEFHPRVQEALREPMENGVIELARGGERSRWPCRFQTIATTNLCPCGRMVPSFNKGCGYSLSRCQSVWRRLSGPVVDRFDLLIFTDGWLKTGERQVSLGEVAERLKKAAQFAARPDRQVCKTLLGGFADLPLSHRRRRALLRVARTLADLGGCKRVSHSHFVEAAGWVLDPMDQLRQLFA